MVHLASQRVRRRGAPNQQVEEPCDDEERSRSPSSARSASPTSMGRYLLRGDGVTTNYDPIAEQYKRSKQQPWRTYIECFTLMKLIGDPHGLSVLDVACGEGFYTRRVRERGAARVTGMDLSHKMLDRARQQDAQNPTEDA